MNVCISKNNIIKLTKISDSIEIDPEGGKRIALRMRNERIEFGIIEEKEGLDTVCKWYIINENNLNGIPFKVKN